MDQFTLDCRQLDQWDFVRQPPVPVRDKGLTKRSSSLEVAALKAAIRLAKPVNPILATLEEIIDIGSKPTRAMLLAPAKMPIIGGAPIIKFSGSRKLTGSFGVAGSAAAGIGFLVSVGLYASNTPEVGVFSTLGGGIFVNTPVLPSEASSP